jgi:hypothetical protein
MQLASIADLNTYSFTAKGSQTLISLMSAILPKE